jgi:hypothetical protein
MKTYKLDDGTVIEVTVSDTYSGPAGKPGCQRTSKNAAWIRINGGEWRMTEYRSNLRLLEAIELSNNIADFLELENSYR